jgi:hypothetical protein
MICYSYKSYGLLHVEKNEDKKYFFKIASLFFLASFLIVPFGSGDMKFYFSAGKAVHEGINPYTESWSINDSFSVLSQSRSQLTGIMYGPVAVTLFKLFYELSFSNLIVFVFLWRLFMIFSLCASGWVLKKIIKIYAIPVSAEMSTVWYITQPLLLFEWVVNGHFDSLWLLCVLLSIYCVKLKKWWLVFFLLILGTWVKFIPLIIAPWFCLLWWQNVSRLNWKTSVLHLLGGGAVGAFFTVLVWFRYWKDFSVFNSIILQSKWAVMSIFSLLYYSLLPLFQLFSRNQSQIHWWLTRIVHGMILIFILYVLYPYLKSIYFIVLKKESHDEKWYWVAIFVCLTTYVLVWQKSFWPWYSLWIVPFGIISANSLKNNYVKYSIMWLSAASLSYYCMYFLGWSFLKKDSVTLLWFNYYIVFAIIFYPLYSLLRWRKDKFSIEEKIINI